MTGTKVLPKVVLDASALLALIQGETGGENVRPMLANAMMSAVNFGETAAARRNAVRGGDGGAAMGSVRCGGQGNQNSITMHQKIIIKINLL